jgi:hypothetical protein
MPNIELMIEKLAEARGGLIAAENAAGQWRNDNVEGVKLTVDQKTALRDAFAAGIQVGKDAITAVEAELANR